MARVAVQDQHASLASGALNASVQSSLFDLNTSGMTIVGWLKVGKPAGSAIWQFQTSGGLDVLRINAEASGKLFTWHVDGAGVGTLGYKMNYSIPLNQWVRIGIVYRTTGVSQLYVNGQLLGSSSAVVTRTAAQFVMFPNNNGLTAMKNVRLYNRPFSSDEFVTDYLYGNIASPMALYSLDEGAGSTVYDTSGNNLHATGASLVWSADVPSRKRKSIGDNMVQNGNFDYYPPYTAPTTSLVYIDGTASGSTAANVFGAWANLSGPAPGVAESRFDTTVSHSGGASMKLSLISGASTTVVGQGISTGFPSNRGDLMVLQPNTAYTLTYWIKTNNCSGNAAYLDLREYSGAGTALTTTSSTKFGGTNDWTQVTMTFTTSATTAYGRIFLRINVAGANCDAWFDDISLLPTLNQTTRQTVQDYKSSMFFFNSSSIHITLPSAMTFTGPFTFAWREKRIDNSTLRFRIGGNGTDTKVGVVSSKWFVRVVGGGSSDNTVDLPALGTWADVALTRDSNNKVDLWVNGQRTRLFSDAAQSGTFTVDRIGSSQGGSYYSGYLAKMYFWNVALSGTDLESWRLSGVVPTTGLVAYYAMNEGAGTGVNDSVGGLNGTTNGSFSADVPTRKRQLVNGNLVQNGDFEYAPPFTAATNTSGRWLDGTAAGSTTSDLFKWASYLEYAGTAEFDSTIKRSGAYSIKVATAAAPPSANHRVEINTLKAAGTTTAAAIQANGIPVLPSTNYTFSGYIRTSAVTNANAQGARYRVATHLADGTIITVALDTPFVSGTNEWALVSGTFTTGATARYAKISAEIRGEQGTAWFDDIDLRPTTANTRGIA